MKLHISTDFLADLDLVYAGRVGLAPTFLRDLDTVYPHARTRSTVRDISAAELDSLSRVFLSWRCSYQQLLKRYLDLLQADDPLRSPVSLFGTMDFGRLETAHTRALAWLLDANEHGFNHRLLEALLRRLRRNAAITVVRARVVSEFVVDGPGGMGGVGRLDILADGWWDESGEQRSWRLVIEAKTDSEVGEEQLFRYDDWLNSQSQPNDVLRVLLTPDGRDAVGTDENWVPLKFLELASLFRGVSGLENCPGYHFLRYYLTGVLRDICNLPVPITVDCHNPYAAVDYVKSVLGVSDGENVNG